MGTIILASLIFLGVGIVIYQYGIKRKQKNSDQKWYKDINTPYIRNFPRVRSPFIRTYHKIVVLGYPDHYGHKKIADSKWYQNNQKRKFVYIRNDFIHQFCIFSISSFSYWELLLTNSGTIDFICDTVR